MKVTAIPFNNGEKASQYILIEGLDGVGKSTICKQLAENEGYEYCREPGGTENTLPIREMLLADNTLHPLTQVALFCADRAEHLNHRVWPLLKEGKRVIQDRGPLSTMVYQHEQGAGSPGQILHMMVPFLSVIEEAHISGIPVMTNERWEDVIRHERFHVFPHILILLKAKPETVLKRLENVSEKNHFDRISLPKLENRSRLYDAAFEYYGHYGLTSGVRRFVVDADRPLEQVYESVLSIIKK